MPESNPYTIPHLYEIKLNQLAESLANLQHEEPEFLRHLCDWLHHAAEQSANEKVQLSYSCLEATLHELSVRVKERSEGQ
jgi:hypothetical protein